MSSNDESVIWVSVVVIVTILRAGQSVIRYLTEARSLFPLQNVLTGTKAHPSYCSMRTRALFGRVKRPICVVQVLRMSGAILPLPVYIFIACTGLN
jgi:hypothetical protein